MIIAIRHPSETLRPKPTPGAPRGKVWNATTGYWDDAAEGAAPKRSTFELFGAAQVAELHQLFRSSPWAGDAAVRAFLGSRVSAFGQVDTDSVGRVKRWFKGTRTKYRTRVNDGVTLTQQAWDGMSDAEKDAAVKSLADIAHSAQKRKPAAAAAGAHGDKGCAGPAPKKRKSAPQPPSS